MLKMRVFLYLALPLALVAGSAEVQVARGGIRGIVILASLASLTGNEAVFAQSGDACAAPEFHQLDFWIGEWEVFSGEDGPKSADVVIEPVLGDCALHEIWTGARPGGNGRGLATYDRRTGEWQYFWASAGGSMSVWTGKLIDGTEMRFVREQPDPDGRTRLRHWSLIDLPDGRVRELSLASLDGGRNWETEYDLYWSEVGR